MVNSIITKVDERNKKLVAMTEKRERDESRDEVLDFLGHTLLRHDFGIEQLLSLLFARAKIDAEVRFRKTM